MEDGVSYTPMRKSRRPQYMICKQLSFWNNYLLHTLSKVFFMEKNKDYLCNKDRVIHLFKYLPNISLLVCNKGVWTLKSPVYFI